MGTEPREYKSNMFILGTDGLWQQGYRIGEFNADIEEKNKQLESTLEQVLKRLNELENR